MILNSTTYILLSLIILLLIILIIVLLKYLRISKEKNKKIDEISFNFKLEIKEFEEETKRQNYVIKNYQEKFQNKNFETEQKNDNSNKISSNKDNDDLNNVLFEKNQLEKEKEQFKDKTKKLWEQSIAIHKEKERIEGLKKTIETTHKQVTDSIRYAKNIQNALLPLDQYLEEILPEHFILFKPRDIVSGDFYWTKQIDNYLVIVAADCTGHGVPGAFMSMLGISSLNEIVAYNNKPNPAEILEELRRKIVNSLHQEDTKLKSRDGMDAAICVFDKNNYELQYAGAYNPLYIIKNKELIEYKATSCPVAYFLKMREFENHIIQLEKGDSAYIFSDGYVDQFGGEAGQKFKSKNFKILLTELSSNNLSMLEIGEKLTKNLKEWKGERYEQVDDILVMGLRF